MTSRADTAARVPRAERASSALTTERILEIAEIMDAGEYGDGKATIAAKAAEWGLAEQTVANMAVESSRLSRLLSAPAVKARLAQALNRGLGVLEDVMAEDDTGSVCDTCGRKGTTAVDGVKALPAVVNAYAGLVGAGAPQRVEVKAVVDEPAWVPRAFEIRSSLTDAQRDRLALASDDGATAVVDIGRLEAALRAGRGWVYAEPVADADVLLLGEAPAPQLEARVVATPESEEDSDGE